MPFNSLNSSKLNTKRIFWLNTLTGWQPLPHDVEGPYRQRYGQFSYFAGFESSKQAIIHPMQLSVKTKKNERLKNQTVEPSSPQEKRGDAPDQNPFVPATPIFLRRLAVSPLPPPMPRQIEERADQATGPIMLKAIIGHPDDEYEKEAEQVAGTLTRAPEPQISRGIADVQAQAFGKMTALPKVNQALLVRSGGNPLSERIRAKIEPVLDHDLSHVRVHADTQAQEAARAIHAKAFTHHNHIFLGKGARADDLGLMSHEATHVAQQGYAGGPPAAGAPPIQRSPLSDELELLWETEGKGALFDRLRRLCVTDPDVHHFIELNLVGDDLWLARNLLTYGAEPHWPIHLRVEREMKGWGDSGGKGVVFDILRGANGTESGNTDLTLSLLTVFAGQPDDLWLSENLQQYGPENNWPIHLRVEREMKGWGDSGGKGVVFDILRVANGTESGNTDLTLSLLTVFAGQPDDLWLSENIQQYGPENNWPIHLRVEREMKGWPDCRGESGVYEVLRTANGSEAGNADLRASLDVIFTGKPEERWYANHLQEHRYEDQKAGTGALTSQMISDIRRSLFPTSTSSTGASLDWDGGSGSTLSAADKIRVRADLVTRVQQAMTVHLNNAMTEINQIAARPRLPISQFQGVGNAAKRVVDDRYGSYTTAAAPTPSQPTGLTEFQMRTSNPGQTLFDAFNPTQRSVAGCPIDEFDLARWIANNDRHSRNVQSSHYFDPNRSAEERIFLWDEIVVPFASLADNATKLRRYDQYGFGISTERGIVMPTGISEGYSTAPGIAGAPSEAVRATKWSGWKLLVHEYLHRLEHSGFTQAARRNPNLVEGFCEMFTKEVLLHEIPTAPANATLIGEVEGGIYSPATTASLVGSYRTPSTYVENLAHAEYVRDNAIGPGHGGESAVKAAYFLGHVELIGLAQTGGMLTPAPGSTINSVRIPTGITTLGELSTASGLSTAEITNANPTQSLTGALPATLSLPGCRNHVVIASIDPATGVETIESKGRVAIQNGITPIELELANPGVSWTALTVGTVLLIPRH
ncbi:DUF4157 domain-containing protein [Desulfurivibrio sp. D14AmB]|uniref:eCIS core domain-containing protein n=1 Tax=Desulfurivibrio sp. D14AmB TaxID=3374370 RepID=UPI00376F2636